MASLKAAEGGKLVQSIDSWHQFLLQQGLAFKQVIHCHHIGVHEQNRDGLGGSSSHVHELLTTVCPWEVQLTQPPVVPCGI